MTYRRTTRYVAARDGTRLAYHTHADPRGADAAALRARRTVLLSNGVGTTEAFWKHLVWALAGDYRVVHWDYRGHGGSDAATSDDYALATLADDFARVTAAVAAEGDGRPPVHVAFSLGVSVLLAAHRAHPAPVAALVLLAGAAEAPYSTALPLRAPGAMPAVRGALAALTPLVGPAAPLVRAMLGSAAAFHAARALGVLRPEAPRADIDEFCRHLARMDLRAFWLTVRGLLAADVSDVLPTVAAPTLVMAAEHDRFVPRAQVRRMYTRIPGARYVEVPGAGHAGLVEFGPEIAAAVRRFLRDAAPPTGGAA